MATRMQQRRGTAAQWISTNGGDGPVLNAGEIGFEVDTNKFKIGDGINHWVDLNYFTDAEGALAEVTALIDGAPAALNTLNELAAAINDDPTFFTTIATNLSNHQSDTTGIHGIADTALLATKSYADNAANAAQTAAATDATTKADAAKTAAELTASNANSALYTTVTGDIATAKGQAVQEAEDYTDSALANLVAAAPSTLDTLNELAAAIADNPNYATDVANLVGTKADTSYVDEEITSVSNTLGGNLSDHESATQNVHGIADTADLATQEFVTDAISNSTDSYPDLAGDGIAWNGVDLAFDVDNTVARTSATDLLASIEYVDDEIIAVRDDAAVAAAALLTGATKTNIAITGDKNGLTITAENGVADSTTDNLSEGTNNLYFNNERAQDAVGNAVGTGLSYNDATGAVSVDTAVIQARVADVSDTEIGYLNGVTSSVQTQIDTKAALVSPTFTGTVSGITKTMVGLGNVDNTADADKPVSTAAQTALDLKANISGPTFTGTVVLPTVSAGGNIIPSTDNTYDLGSPTKMWKDIYVGPGSLYVNGQKVLQDESGAIVVSADINENLGLRTSGSGNIELDPTGTGSVNIKGPLVVEAGAAFSSNDGNGIAFSNGLKSNSLESNSLNTDLSLSGNGTGKVYLNDNAEVSGNLVVGGNLTVSGTTTTVNSETISLADNIIDLNSNFTTGTPTENSGLRIMRGDSAPVQIRWNESSDAWEFTNDGTNYSPIASLSSPTFTGTVSGITKSMVGLGNVDNTTDAEKPISSATQTALDAKLASATAATTYAPIASPTFTGTVVVPTLTLTNPLSAANGGTGLSSLATGVATFLGTPSSANLAAMLTDEIGTGNVVLSEVATSPQDASYTLVAADRGKLVEMNVGSANTLTVPLHSSVPFPIGTQIDILQVGSGKTTVAGATVGVTINATPGRAIRAQWGGATLIKRGENTWVLIGDLTTV
jgi:hypothetical protein